MRHESDNPIELLRALLRADDSHSLCEMLRQAGEDKLLERDRIIQEACTRCRLVKLGDHVIPYIQTTDEEDRHVSNIGNYMCRVLYPDAPFAWVKTHDGKSSLRSTEFDVSVVANEYGGGGHKQASGFSRSVDPIEL